MAPPVIDDLWMINSALRRFGAGTIGDIDEDSDLADQTVPIYFETVDALYGLWHWKWPRRIRKLDQAVVDPSETMPDPNDADATAIALGYRNAFNFPAGAMGPPEKLFVNARAPNSPLRDFMVEGTQVRCNASTLFGVFILRQDVSLWPPYIRTALTMWLQGIYCVPVAHDANLAQQLLVDAIGTPSEGMRGGMMGRAIAMDAAGSGGLAGMNVDDTLTGVHFGNGGNPLGSSGGW